MRIVHVKHRKTGESVCGAEEFTLPEIVGIITTVNPSEANCVRCTGERKFDPSVAPARRSKSPNRSEKVHFSTGGGTVACNHHKHPRLQGPLAVSETAEEVTCGLCRLKLEKAS